MLITAACGLPVHGMTRLLFISVHFLHHAVTLQGVQHRGHSITRQRIRMAA